ncbi:MAG: hypothetical protein RIE52_01010 [Balneola sp.]|jgi:hypothetical protein
MHKFKNLLLIAFLGLIPAFSFAQNETDSTKISNQFETTFNITPAGAIEYTTPQKYGVSFNLSFGIKTREIRYYENNPPLSSQSLKGVNLEAGIYRGGYRFGASYVNLTSSMVGAAGIRIGLVYLMNNSFSSVLKSSDLIGIEAELYAFYKFKIGLLKATNEDVYIPSLGFGFTIGPNLF